MQAKANHRERGDKAQGVLLSPVHSSRVVLLLKWSVWHSHSHSYQTAELDAQIKHAELEAQIKRAELEAQIKQKQLAESEETKRTVCHVPVFLLHSDGHRKWRYASKTKNWTSARWCAPSTRKGNQGLIVISGSNSGETSDGCRAASVDKQVWCTALTTGM
jgi:hypothetical protein